MEICPCYPYYKKILRKMVNFFSRGIKKFVGRNISGEGNGVVMLTHKVLIITYLITKPPTEMAKGLGPST